jgi:hypothetical protein
MICFTHRDYDALWEKIKEKTPRRSSSGGIAACSTRTASPAPPIESGVATSRCHWASEADDSRSGEVHWSPKGSGECGKRLIPNSSTGRIGPSGRHSLSRESSAEGPVKRVKEMPPVNVVSGA